MNPLKPRSKYGNTKTSYNGMTFDSKAEAERARQLDDHLKRGEIRGWTRQVTFRLGVPENVYRCDFLVFGVANACGVWAEDVKGMLTPKFKRDVKLWRRYGPCNLHVIKGKKTEIIKPEPGAMVEVIEL